MAETAPPTCPRCGAGAITHESGALVCTVEVCGFGWEHVITVLPGHFPAPTDPHYPV